MQLCEIFTERERGSKGISVTKYCEIRHLEATVLDGPPGFARGEERRVAAGGSRRSALRAGLGRSVNITARRLVQTQELEGDWGEEGGVRVRTWPPCDGGGLRWRRIRRGGNGELSFADDHRGKHSGHLQPLL
jgi:hypothetical protein